jgi:hypothetical protein
VPTREVLPVVGVAERGGWSVCLCWFMNHFVVSAANCFV